MLVEYGENQLNSLFDHFDGDNNGVLDELEYQEYYDTNCKTVTGIVGFEYPKIENAAFDIWKVSRFSS